NDNFNDVPVTKKRRIIVDNNKTNVAGRLKTTGLDYCDTSGDDGGGVDDDDNSGGDNDNDNNNNNNNVSLMKKRRIDDDNNTTKVAAGLKSTGLDLHCDPSGGDDNSDNDPHMAFFRRVLDANNNNNAATTTATATANTALSSYEERERVLHISMKIIEKEFQILNKKAQFFENQYKQKINTFKEEIENKNSSGSSSSSKKEIRKDDNDEEEEDGFHLADDPNTTATTATNTATTATTNQANCKERENILHVSFRMIQKQIQLLNERAQFFNKILLQEHTHKQIFKKEIEERMNIIMKNKEKEKEKEK
ncbi:MAG: hypothetical protein ACI8RD_011599, partial [Bacillariaceae sp.]